jgi:hypothetical protein
MVRGPKRFDGAQEGRAFFKDLRLMLALTGFLTSYHSGLSPKLTPEVDPEVDPKLTPPEAEI